MVMVSDLHSIRAWASINKTGQGQFSPPYLATQNEHAAVIQCLENVDQDESFWLTLMKGLFLIY